MGRVGNLEQQYTDFMFPNLVMVFTSTIVGYYITLIIITWMKIYNTMDHLLIKQLVLKLWMAFGLFRFIMNGYKNIKYHQKEKQ